MEDAGLCAASTVAGCLVAPVNRLCGYVISYDSHVCKLEDKVAELGKKRQEVQDSINDAQNNGKTIKAYVNEWVIDVENHAKEARRVLDDKAKITCFRGWLPNLKVRYRLGREARRKAERIQGLINRALSGKVYNDPPSGLVDGTSDVISSAGDRGDTIFDSQASILQGIMNALDDEEHRVVGFYGPGGVGKTTLLEEVEKKLRKEGRPFNMIVKSKVSQTPDFREIQFNIAYALGLKDLKDEPSEEGRRNLLFKRLQKDPSEKILIILDDLWKEVNLRAVGIPLGGESRGNQVLLTSRYKNVLEQMKCAPHIFHLEGLKNDEAIRLLEKTVGDRLKDKQLKTIADQLVKKLAGLPLLINSVAISLKDRPVAAWSSALKTIDWTHIENIVKWSYDHLKSEDTKTLFLLCGLIGGTIQVEILLVLGMGLGLFEESRLTMQESRDRLYTMLDDLRFACLLLDGGDDKDNVTIHDLYSEAVVSTPFRGQNPLMMNSNYGSWRKEELEKCWAICLPDVGIDRVAELMRHQFPDLKILMLSQPHHWDYQFPNSKILLLSQPNYSHWMLQRWHDTADCSVLLNFTFMEKLQVLCVSSIHIARLPSSIGILQNLHSLYLDYCNVDDATILGKLKALQILSLVGSALSTLPKEIGDLTNLRSLNLSDCNRLQTIEPGVLERLIKLEELYLHESFDQWMGKDGIPSESCNARLAELKSLTKIASLEISIPDPSVLSEDDDFPFGNLIKFWINIGKAKGWTKGKTIGGLRTMELKLEEWDIILSKEWVQKILQKTQYLYLDGLNTPESIANSPSIESIANSSNGEVEVLADDTGEEVLDIDNSPSIESIAHSSNGEVEVLADDTVELPNLCCLDLCALPKMTSFCTEAEGAPIPVSLLNLEFLQMVRLLGPERILSGEPSLKYSNLRLLIIEESKSTSKSILKLDLILKLPNLESMAIDNSPLAEVVFDLEELEVTKDVEILSRLTLLTLDCLPKLQRIWKRDVQLQGLSILRNLRRLCVCETGLSFLFSVSIAKCIREIRVIKLLDCPNMKAVIVDEGRNEGTYDIIEFPLLEHLSIMQCPVEKFFPYPCGKKEPVITASDSQDANSDSFFDQKVTFPNITVLEIDGLKCKELWNDQIPINSFQKLKSLKLENCDNLRHIAPPKMWKVLQHGLKKLEVISCRLIKIIYKVHEMDTEGGELEELILYDLENMEHIWQSEDLPNVPFPNLINIEAVKCPHLEVLFTTFTAKFLGQIKELVVRYCKNMRLIADQELGVESCEDMKLIPAHEKGEERTGTTVAFSKLTFLSLDELPNLSGFLPGNYHPLEFIDSKDHFPSLEIYSIRDCGAYDRFRGDWENHELTRFNRRGRWYFRSRDWFPPPVNDW